MKPFKLQEIVDPYACADQQRRYSGRLGVSDLKRLRPLLADDRMDLTAELNFYREGRFPVVAVRIQAKLVLQCNTCLEAFDWRVDHQVRLVVVESPDEFDFIPDDCEPWLLEEHKASLIELIEDELLLELPQVPKHQACGKQLPSQRTAVDLEPAKTKKNPFEALKALKHTDSAGDH